MKIEGGGGDGGGPLKKCIKNYKNVCIGMHAHVHVIIIQQG